MTNNNYNVALMVSANNSELCAPDIEEKMIGALIGKRNVYDAYRDTIDVECFSTMANQSIFKAIENSVKKGNDPDLLAVSEEIKIVDRNIDIAKIIEIYNTYHGDYINRLVDILQIYKKKRFVYYTGMTMMSKAKQFNEDIDDCIQSVTLSLQKTSMAENVQDVTMDSVIDEILATARETRLGSNQKAKGSYTGFPFIDNKGGLKYSNLIIIAAETSQGKTSLALNMATNAMRYGSKVAFYSMEMTNKELTARIISSWSGVSSSDIQYQKLWDNEMSAVEDAAQKLSAISSSLHFDDRSESNIDTIISSIRSKKTKYNIDGAIIDYIQILNVTMRNTNKEQAMGDVARKLKNLAKELGIWIIALSQLSRDREHPEPSLSRLRDSGQIAEAADEVYLIYRPEAVNAKVYPKPFEEINIKGTAMIVRAKGRGVGLGSSIVGFDDKTTTFYHLNELPKNYARTSDEDKPF